MDWVYPFSFRALLFFKGLFWKDLYTFTNVGSPSCTFVVGVELNINIYFHYMYVTRWRNLRYSIYLPSITLLLFRNCRGNCRV
ncbi:hypothetical protein HYPSUDRAFT_818562 [Hypholoma sublateritium FD-334 SS-4]|uniref:Uncharacterized protein n=1 Tax=Hypholoma sublateritium (strain FD-334 SS-4) TaxID=945553 RepID=A0A0D2PKA2_HYPSF|nr:hypothetical protein HYPSUDRAFT_818562 [Hypholoma sublateritium FD-334 SS-4]